MPLDPSAENIATIIGIDNLKQIAGHDAWANAQRQTSQFGHADRTDKFAEVAYQNAITAQQLQTQSAHDHQVEVRAINKMFLGALANKFINQDVEQAIADSQVMKGNANSDMLSLLSQAAAGQISGKIAMTTPPTTAADTGFSTLLAMQNTLNQQNYSNNTTNSSLAALMSAMAAIVSKNVVNAPPMGSGDAK
jgi:hypothetical protein